MQLLNFPRRRLIGAAALACAAVLIPAAACAAASAAAPASWKIVKTVPGNNSFDAVTATGPHSAWAFESTSSTPAAWRLSGSRWIQSPFPFKADQGVGSAASTAPDDVWAVAGSQVLSFNGTTWAPARSYPGSGGEVAALSLRDAWVFDGTNSGTGRTWHWNGERWSAVPGGHGLTDGSALSPDSVWAISATDVAHWNGHTWSRTSVKSLLAGCPREPDLCSPGLSGIYAQSPDNIWAVGTGHRETIGGPVVVLHFNGRHWSRAALTGAARDPVPGQVIPDGTGGLWIPTGGFEGHQPSEMMHYSGGHLGFAALPAAKRGVLSINAMAAVPGTSRAIGAAVAYGAYQSAVILAYDSGSGQPASGAAQPQQRQLAVTTLSNFKMVLTATRAPGTSPGPMATITAAGYRHTSRGWELIATKRIGAVGGWSWYATQVCSLTVTQTKPGPPSGSPAAVWWDSMTVTLLWDPAIGCERPITTHWR